MFKIPENILDVFFQSINRNGKYEIIFEKSGALIKPRLEEEYYKPVIIVKNLDELKCALENFVKSLNDFYGQSKTLRKYHNLEYFFYNLFFNMTTSDAYDLAHYINQRSYFFSNKHFSEFIEPKLLVSVNNVNIYVERCVESVGLETPYILAFSIEINGKIYQLPLVRYAIDENNVCHLFAIQYGRKRNYDITDDEDKKIINQINSGVTKYRNVAPSFVIVFRVFLEMLKSNNVNKIVVPDFLFGRYKHYYKAQGTMRSDEILERILDNFLILLKRMEWQFPFFEIESYPNEIDSYTHVKLKNCGNDK